MEWIILILIGLVASSLGSLIGLGGGIIIVPALLSLGAFTQAFGEITPQIAVGSSLFTMIFTGLSSTLAYLKHKTVDYKSGLIFLIGSGPGGILGAWMNKTLEIHSFNIYFGVFMVLISIILMLKSKLKPLPFKVEKGIIRVFTDPKGETFEYGYRAIVAIIISFAVGFLSGMFGVGGGSLMVPAMIVIFLFPPHVAVATSMFMIFPTSLLSSITHISLGNVNWLFTLALIPGAWIGAKIGVNLNTKLKSSTIVTILRVILVIIGIRMVYQGLGL
jgi:uncharacterized protein